MPGSFVVVAVMVDYSINRIPVARIILKDGDPAAQTFKSSNSTELEPGKNIKIEAGFHNKNEVIFEGLIIKQQIRLKNGIDSFLVLECKDKAYKMTLTRKSKYFIDSSDSDAVETILTSNGLQKDIQNSSVTHKQLVQYNCSDWDFLVSRMELNGMVVLAKNGKVTAKKPSIASATCTMAFGKDVINFEASLDASNQYQSVTCKAWDMSSQDIASSDDQPTNLTEAGDLTSSSLAGKVNDSKIIYYHSGKIPVDELKNWATAIQTKNILSKAKGILTCKGKFEAKLTETIELTGFGNHFNGKHFISGVRHDLKDNLWETTIQFGLSHELFTEQFAVNNPPSSGIIPSVNGLQIAVVTQLECDPSSEFRIQVKFPLMDNKAEGIWARISTLDAGDTRGSFFLPEVGDEVIVGFINDDPRDAIILGMLNSSKNPAPLTPTKENNEKGFFTRSKMKILFNDDKKILTLHTPAGKEIILDDDDQKKIIIKDENNNKIEMSSDGIIIESCKDIKFKASGDIKGEGVNVEMKGSGNFKAEGSGGAKLSSSGTTELKGSIININ